MELNSKRFPSVQSGHSSWPAEARMLLVILTATILCLATVMAIVSTLENVLDVGNLSENLKTLYTILKF